MKLIIDGESIDYDIVYSKRAKYIKIGIKNNRVVLTIPKASFFQSKKKLEKKGIEFLFSKKDWIKKHLNKKNNFELLGTKEDFIKNKQKALKICEEKCAYFAKIMQVSYNKISIKNNKTKWGSCSSRKNLNFHYKIVYLNEEEQNYLIVHELAHLKHMNHSKDFWDFVCKTLGDEKFRKYRIKGGI